MDFSFYNCTLLYFYYDKISVVFMTLLDSFLALLSSLTL